MKKMNIYYRTENDAEDARAKFETLKVENISVERIPEPSRNELPITIQNVLRGEQEDEHDPYVLHVEVDEAEIAETNEIIRETGGAMEE